MTDQDTAELVRRAAAGDELAWRQFIDGLGPLLRRVSARGCRVRSRVRRGSWAACWRSYTKALACVDPGYPW
jgi:hypothetical protein